MLACNAAEWKKHFGAWLQFWCIYATMEIYAPIVKTELAAQVNLSQVTPNYKNVSVWNDPKYAFLTV